MTGAPKLSGSQVTAAACVAVIVPGVGAWVGPSEPLSLLDLEAS